MSLLRCTACLYAVCFIGFLGCDTNDGGSNPALPDAGGAVREAQAPVHTAPTTIADPPPATEAGPEVSPVVDDALVDDSVDEASVDPIDAGTEPQSPEAGVLSDAGAPDAAGAIDASLDAGSLSLSSADAGDARAPVDATAPVFLVEPSFVPNDNAAAPLVGLLRFETSAEVMPSVTVSGWDEEWTLTLPSGRAFDYPILGLEPATTYSLSLSFEVDGVQESFGPLEWTTPSLPSNFPPLYPIIAEPEQMEPGMTLFNARIGSGATSFLIAVDHEGAVRWFYQSPSQPVRDAAQQLDNGNFLFGISRCAFAEVDLRGFNVTTWYAEEHFNTCPEPDNAVAVPAANFHHETRMLDNGNLLALTIELRDLDAFPTSEDDELASLAPATIMSSVVLEFTREGEVLKYIPIADLLDPGRIGRDSLETGWSGNQLAAGDEAYDWDHGNAVIYEEASDSYYVSLRHQDAVIKINRSDETLTWILGTPSNWKAPWTDKLLQPTGELTWQFHQHAVELTPLGLGMYDNGNHRAAAFEPLGQEYGRAVIFDVDEANMSVSQVWSYGAAAGPDHFFSPIMGDADWQPTTGNVLITNGEIDTGPYIIGQVMEVTPEGERVFQLDVGGDTTVTTRYTSYRAERIVDLRQLTFTADGQPVGLGGSELR